MMPPTPKLYIWNLESFDAKRKYTCGVHRESMISPNYKNPTKFSKNKACRYSLASTIWKNLWDACVRYFYQIFIFFTKWQSFKNYEKCFLFHLKSSFCSQDVQIFVFFPLPFNTFQKEKDKFKWNNLWCHELACINLQMQFLK